MSAFSSHSVDRTCVALLDIGSASVTASIACSYPGGDLEVLYSTQERILLRQITSTSETGKRVMSAVMNTMLDLGQSGVHALHEKYPKTQLESLQVSIAAPWSYTITKDATYKKEEPFAISKHLYKDLLDSVNQDIADELQEHEVADHLGLRVVSRAITALRANGYIIPEPLNQTANDLTISLCTTVIQDYLHDMIVDVHNKILPKSELKIHSLMYVLYNVLQDIHPEMEEYCIINQTLEAIELGIVRNGELTYSTHEPYGTITIVRKIAAITNSSIDEIYGAIQTDVWKTMYEKYPAATKAKVDAVLEEYQNTVSSLMKQTGDGFTIPKTIYMHTASCAHRFLAPHIESGAVIATNLAHIVHNIDTDLLQSIATSDIDKNTQSCVELISSYHFHTHNQASGVISR